jgi:hypothetical protein
MACTSTPGSREWSSYLMTECMNCMASILMDNVLPLRATSRTLGGTV